MKCICGYNDKVDEFYNESKIGDFIRITPPVYYNSIEDMKNVDIDEKYVQYACPKCGTVKVNI